MEPHRTRAYSREVSPMSDNLSQVIALARTLTLEELAIASQELHNIRREYGQRKLWSMSIGDRVRYIGQFSSKLQLHHGDTGTITDIKRVRVTVKMDNNRYSSIVFYPSSLERIEETPTEAEIEDAFARIDRGLGMPPQTETATEAPNVAEAPTDHHSPEHATTDLAPGVVFCTVCNRVI